MEKNDDATTAKLRRPKEKCSPVTGGRRWSLQVSPRANQDLEQPRGRRHRGGAPAIYRHQLEVARQARLMSPSHFSSSRCPRRVPAALDVLLDRRISIVWAEVFIWTRSWGGSGIQGSDLMAGSFSASLSLTNKNLNYCDLL